MKFTAIICIKNEIPGTASGRHALLDKIHRGSFKHKLLLKSLIQSFAQ